MAEDKKTKVRVIAKGIFGAKGMIPIGKEFTINGDIPKGWRNKCTEIGSRAAPKDPDPAKVAATGQAGAAPQVQQKA